MSKIVKLHDVRVVNLAPRQEGVWAGRIVSWTLKLATYRSDWPTALPAALYQRKLLGARLWEADWPLKRSGPFRRDKLFALLGTEPRLVGPTARIMCAVPTELSGSLKMQKRSMCCCGKFSSAALRVSK